MEKDQIKETPMTKEQYFNQVASLIEFAANFEGHTFIAVVVITAEDEDGNPVKTEDLDDSTGSRTRIIHNGDGFMNGILTLNQMTAHMAADHMRSQMEDDDNEPEPPSYTVQ